MLKNCPFLWADRGDMRYLPIVLNPPCFFSIEIRESHISFLFNILAGCHHDCFGRGDMNSTLIFPSSVDFCQDMGRVGPNISNLLRDSWTREKVSTATAYSKLGRGQYKTRRGAGVIGVGVGVGVPPPLDHTLPLESSNGSHILCTFPFVLRVSPCLSFYGVVLITRAEISSLPKNYKK